MTGKVKQDCSFWRTS